VRRRAFLQNTIGSLTLLVGALAYAQPNGRIPNSTEKKVKNVVIVGANGQTSRELIPRLLKQDDVHLTLFLRNSARLENLKSSRVTLFEGDANNLSDLVAAFTGQDIVISTMGGLDLDKKTANIVNAMNTAKVNRVIVISAGGIYNELPEPFNTWDKAVVGQYRVINLRTAEVVEASKLTYTVLRPVWLTNKSIEDFQLTRKGETYKGKETSRASLARFIADIVKNPSTYTNEDLGISQAGT
jgi:putative NADH-flavin reductase